MLCKCKMAAVVLLTRKKTWWGKCVISRDRSHCYPQKCLLSSCPNTPPQLHYLPKGSPKAFPGLHYLYPFKDAHKKWVSFLLLQMGIQALLISGFFFFSFLLSETLLSWNVPQIFSFPAPRQWMVLDSDTSVISSYKAGEWIPRH